ncbi:MAG: hypothetical protein KDB07_09685 [Planctomycetes bacterium]|nr:hypothetical protein [Planctomycetota bacterium]
MVPEDLQPANAKEVYSATREMIAEGLFDDLYDDDDFETTQPVKLRAQVAPRQQRKGAVNRGRLLGTLFIVALLGVAGTYVYVNYIAEKEQPIVEKEPENLEVSPILVPDYKPASDKAIDRVRPTSDAMVTQPLPPREAPKVSRESVLGRLDFLSRGDEESGYALLAPPPEQNLPEEGLPTISKSEFEEEVGIRSPGGREDVRRALSPMEYPKAGLEPIEYWKLLRNQLLLRNDPDQPEGAQIDLEKAWILLSLFYNPNLDIEEHRSYLSRLAAELYNRLIVIDDSGDAVLRGTEAERVRTVINFLLNGDTASGGWDVQEFHPGIRNMGIPPYDQNYLIDEVFLNGDKNRNSASNTSLNLLTLVLLRKIGMDLDGDGERIGVNVPIYGMRLPDRTILRYDARGANAILLSQEERSRVEARSFGDFSVDTRIEPDYKGYTRNIELIRNGNHYDAEEYQRRYQISDSDAENGVYLRTLSDRRMFASLGYELAMADVQRARLVASTDFAQAEMLYDRAERFLTEWVLDRDNGDGDGFMRKRRYAPNHPQPRGDLLLRDAHILLAELYLQRADYPAIAALIENDFGLSTDGERAQTLRALLQASRQAIEGARASFTDVMKFDDRNPFANLYLGEFDFLSADASLPAIYQWKPSGEVNGLDELLTNVINQDIDKMASAINHFNIAEANDRGRLNGQQRFTLHLHRALAYEQKGQLINAIADLQRAGQIDPEYGRSPSYQNIDRRLRYARVFEVLEKSNGEEDGQLMYDAISFLDKNLLLQAEMRYELGRTIDALDMIKNIAIQWEVVAVLKRVTGKDFGRSATLWKNWLNEHFKRAGDVVDANNSRIYARAFRVISGPMREFDLDQKQAAVEYIRKNLKLNRDNRINIERTVDSLTAFEGRAVQGEIVKTLQELTGQEIGNDAEAWRSWLHEYFRRNP